MTSLPAGISCTEKDGLVDINIGKYINHKLNSHHIDVNDANNDTHIRNCLIPGLERLLMHFINCKFTEDVVKRIQKMIDDDIAYRIRCGYFKIGWEINPIPITPASNAISSFSTYNLWFR